MKKNKILKILIIYIAFLVITSISAFLIDFYLGFSSENYHWPIIASFLALTLFFNLLVLFYIHYYEKSKKENIQKSYEFFLDQGIENIGVGVLIFNHDEEIIWISSFLEKIFNKKLIGKSINTINKDFSRHFFNNEENFVFSINNFFYQVNVDLENKTITFKDITIEENLNDIYWKEKIVIGEMEIDNYQQLQTILSEEELFKSQSELIKILDELVEKHNIIYRINVGGKILLITNEKTLNQFKMDNFDFLDNVRKIRIKDNINLTISVGFGAGSSNLIKIIQLAKDGLLQSQSRGGDQITIQYNDAKPRYFGATVENINSSSRVRINQMSSLIEKKISEKRIKNIIIYGHINADLDALGASLGLYEMCSKTEKNVYIQNKTFDLTTTNFLNENFTKEEINNIFINKSQAKKITNSTTLVFIVDTSELDRIENSSALEKVNRDNIFIIDHHRVSKVPENIPVTNMYIDTSSSSASEIISEILILSNLIVKIPKRIAQAMLNGIYLDTKRFSKSVTSRTFEASAWLEKHGANGQEANDILKIPASQYKLIAQILLNTQEIKPGFFLVTYDNELSDDVISIISDEILRIQGRKASFVIAKSQGNNFYKMSARGINTNVQIIAEQVGGGGHFGAAAATSKENMEIFVDNVIQAIVSQKER